MLASRQHKNRVLPKSDYKPKKKSTRCRDVKHTGLQSTQTRRNYSSNNTGKQGAQTRGTRYIFQSIPTSVAALHVYNNQYCIIELISKSNKYHAAINNENNVIFFLL